MVNTQSNNNTLDLNQNYLLKDRRVKNIYNSGEKSLTFESWLQGATIEDVIAIADFLWKDVEKITFKSINVTDYTDEFKQLLNKKRQKNWKHITFDIDTSTCDNVTEWFKRKYSGLFESWQASLATNVWKFLAKQVALDIPLLTKNMNTMWSKVAEKVWFTFASKKQSIFEQIKKIESWLSNQERKEASEAMSVVIKELEPDKIFVENNRLSAAEMSSYTSLEENRNKHAEIQKNKSLLDNKIADLTKKEQRLAMLEKDYESLPNKELFVKILENRIGDFSSSIEHIDKDIAILEEEIQPVQNTINVHTKEMTELNNRDIKQEATVLLKEREENLDTNILEKEQELAWLQASLSRIDITSMEETRDSLPLGPETRKINENIGLAKGEIKKLTNQISNVQATLLDLKKNTLSGDVSKFIETVTDEIDKEKIRQNTTIRELEASIADTKTQIQLLQTSKESYKQRKLVFEDVYNSVSQDLSKRKSNVEWAQFLQNKPEEVKKLYQKMIDRKQEIAQNKAIPDDQTKDLQKNLDLIAEKEQASAERRTTLTDENNMLIKNINDLEQKSVTGLSREEEIELREYYNRANEIGQEIKDLTQEKMVFDKQKETVKQAYATSAEAMKNTPLESRRVLLEEIDEVQQALATLEGSLAALDWSYNQTKHKDLINKRNDAKKDQEIKIEARQNKFLNAIENDPKIAAAVATLNSWISKIIPELLAQIKWKDSPLFDFRKALSELQNPKYSPEDMRWSPNVAKFLSQTANIFTDVYKYLSLTVVWTAAWVGIAQLALKFKPYEVTDDNAIFTIIAWWLVWSTAFWALDKYVYEQRIKDTMVKKFLKNHKGIFRHFVHYKTVLWFVATLVLFFWDASSIWVLTKGEAYSEYQASKVMHVQNEYKVKFAEITQKIIAMDNQILANLDTIGKKEDAGDYWAPWRWPKRCAQQYLILWEEGFKKMYEYLKNKQDKTQDEINDYNQMTSAKSQWLALASEAAIAAWFESVDLFSTARSALQQKIQSLDPENTSVVFEGDTIHWNDMAEHTTTFGKKYHGAEAALPSTNLRKTEYIANIEESLAKNTKNITNAVVAFNTEWTKVQTAIKNEAIWWNIELELVNQDVINQDIPALTATAQVIIDQLKQIESYTDIVSMSKFVLEQQGKKWFAELLGALVIFLVLLHGGSPMLHWFRARTVLWRTLNNLRRYGQEQNDMADTLVKTIFPYLLIDERGRERLMEMDKQELDLDDNELQRMIETSLQDPKFSSSEDVRVTKIVQKFTNDITGWLRTCLDVFETITKDDERGTINLEVWVRPFGGNSAQYVYQTYLQNKKPKDINSTVLMTFAMPFFQQSATFRKLFYDKMLDENSNVGKI